MAKKDHPIQARLSNLREKAPIYNSVEGGKRLGEMMMRESLNKAFKYFGLDPQKASDQAWIPFLLAEAVFGGAGQGGRKEGTKYWNMTRLLKLGRLLDEFTASDPGVSDVKCAAEIAKRPEYKHLKERPRAIRRQFPEARRVLKTLKEAEAGNVTDWPALLLYFVRDIEMQAFVLKLADEDVKNGKIPPGCRVEVRELTK
jgi:hypothetical protein